MEQLFIARHAESAANANGVINADPSVHNPLSERGTEQAARLASALRDVAIDVCFTSAHLRAKHTAEIALMGRQVPTVTLSAFNEPDAGSFEGGSVDGYNEWVVTKGFWARNPGGESQIDALRRFLEAFDAILEHPR